MPKQPAWIAERIERVRLARRRQGHALTPLQEGIVASIAAWDPQHVRASRQALAEIKETVQAEGKWSNQEEWRISTWSECEIVRMQRDGADWYQVCVACDGQKLACGCPTLEQAYAFMRLYQELIVDQFYSIGPPWADSGIFAP
jgi:hypothetical protein